MALRPPHWPLDDVKTTAAEHNGVLLKKTRALDFFHKPAVAYATARRVIADLTLSDFSESKQQQFDEWFDIYGIRIGSDGWMLKFTIDESQPQVVIVSLHPLERPIRTNGGVVNP
jgi:hypothetical protein